MNYIYLAAPYHRREELKRYARRLRAQGHDVTSRWLSGAHDSADCMTDDLELRRQWAEEDLEDLAEADILIVFPLSTEEGGRQRGGVHVEFGYAIANDKRIIAVGGRPNVFYCLPEVEAVNTFEEALELLK